LGNPVEAQPTEAFLPVAIEVGPIWDHVRKRGAWFAALTVDLPGAVWDDCDHHHPTKDEAWECGHTQLRQLVKRVTRGRRP
jgi:hypothetical protein